MIKFDTKPAQPVSKSQGFTLIELMVTIAVLAIIVSIAAPNISTQLANQRVKSTTATLENALKEARAESVIRRQKVTVNIEDNDHVIEIEPDYGNQTVITTYNYHPKSIIKGDDDIEFQPNKTADNKTFIICDVNKSASPRQIEVSKLGIINSKLGGSC